MKNTLFSLTTGILLIGFKGYFPSDADAASRPADTIYVGANREWKSLYDFFRDSEPKSDVHLIVDAGEYRSEEIWVSGDNITIEGKGDVSLYCTEANQNVMWITGSHIVIRNFHMKHLLPGDIEGNNCTGRVIAFDNAHDVTIEDCDLNGCGLAGLHDNTGNSGILVKHNYIHDNSVGAYTDIDGNAWFREIKDHPVFTFVNNRMENNGPKRTAKEDSLDAYIVTPTGNPVRDISLRMMMESTIEEWKNVANPLIATYEGIEYGDYFHLIFNGSNEEVYDFGFGDNRFGKFKLHYRDEEHPDSGEITNPEYAGGIFKVYWEWKVTTIPCCEGEYEPAKVLYPSIVKLELVKAAPPQTHDGE